MVTEAYEILGNVESREKYDNNRDIEIKSQEMDIEEFINLFVKIHLFKKFNSFHSHSHSHHHSHQHDPSCPHYREHQDDEEEYFYEDEDDDDDDDEDDDEDDDDEDDEDDDEENPNFASAFSFFFNPFRNSKPKKIQPTMPNPPKFKILDKNTKVKISWEKFSKSFSYKLYMKKEGKINEIKSSD